MKGRQAVLCAGAWALLLVAEATAGDGAPARQSDVFYAGGSLEDLSPGGGGRAASLGWQHVLSPRLSTDAGLAWSSLELTRWHFARLGVHLRLGGTTAYADTQLGSGRRPGGGFPYRVYRAGVVAPLAPGRLFLDLGGQHLHVDQARGFLSRLAIVAAPARSVTAEVALHRSLGGTLGARYLAVRVDVRRRGLGGLAGLNVGRSQPEVLAAWPAPATHSTQVFAGARVPVADQELTLVASSLRIERFTRNGLELAWVWRPRRAPRS